jgi:hypothetical protein
MAGYGDDAGFDAWLAANGYDLPVDAPDRAVLRERGSVYIDGLYGARFPGSPTAGYAQERAWPRTGATTFGGDDIPGNQIPVAVINASYAAAYYEALNPGGLSIATTGASQVKREKIGPIETEYAVSDGDALAGATPKLLQVEGLLKSFLYCPFGAVLVV